MGVSGRRFKSVIYGASGLGGAGILFNGLYEYLGNPAFRRSINSVVAGAFSAGPHGAVSTAVSEGQKAFAKER